MQNEPDQPNVISPTTTDSQYQTQSSGAERPVSYQSQSTPPVSQESHQESRKKPKKLLVGIAALVVLVVVLAGGYVFAFYLPNRPANVYKTGLDNTGKAVDTLVSYSQQQQTAHYKSVALQGTVNVASAGGSYDVTLDGSADKSGDVSANISADIVGQKIAGSIKSIAVKNSTAPDIYFQVNKAQKLLSQYGLQKYNGQWIAVDHTVLDTLLNKYAQNATQKTVAPTDAQINDAVTKIQAVNKQYLFTTDSSTAVLTKQKFLGKVQLNGRTAYHYKVGYNKAHLQAYVTAVKKALDSSQLNNWSQAANKKPLSQVVNFSDIDKMIQNATSNYTFDLWIDGSTKLVSKLQFTDPKDSSSSFSLSQNYTGGDQYPFALSFSGKDSSGNPSSGTLDLTLNQKTNKTTLKLTSSSQSSNGKTTANANFSLTPGNSTLHVTAPSSSTPVTTVINDVLGGLLGGSSTSAPATKSTAIGL